MATMYAHSVCAHIRILIEVAFCLEPVIVCWM